jgi:hypothetical protein
VVLADTPLPFGLDIQTREWFESDTVLVQAAAVDLVNLNQAVDALNAQQMALGPYHSDLVAPTVAAAKLATETGALTRAEAAL